MQLNSDISIHQIEIIERIFRILTFAAQLVLLVVILGRDRARRYPWFTAGIALAAMQLMAKVLLVGRMAMLPLQETLITLNDMAAIVGLLVVVEMARRAFAGVHRATCLVNAAGMLVVAGGVLAILGPWPVWKQVSWNSAEVKLWLLQLAAQKGELLAALLTVGLGLLVVFFGRRYKAAWRSHTHSIVIGLFAVAISLLAMEAPNQILYRTPQFTRDGYIHMMHVLLGFAFAHETVYIAALVWWIVWLWRDEPGTAAEAAAATADAADTTEEKR